MTNPIKKKGKRLKQTLLKKIYANVNKQMKSC